MNEVAIQGFVRRARQASGAEENAVYLRIRVGSARRHATTIASKIPVEDRDPGELVNQIREILAGNDGEEPRAWIEALRVGSSDVVDTVSITIADPDDVQESPKSTADHLGTAMLVIERMARNADHRADMADMRAQTAQADVMGFLARAMEAESETAQVAILAEQQGSAGDRKIEQINALANSPLGRAVGMKLLGLKPTKGKPDGNKQIEAKTDEKPGTDAKAQAMAALDALKKLRADNPDLAGDSDLIAGITSVITGD